MQITIIRHGEPDLSDWGKVATKRMPEWVAAYNLTGVKNESNPIVQEISSLISGRFIVCSNLQRSIHSAKLVGCPSPNLVDAIFREAELPDIQLPLMRLKPHSWTVVFRLLWLAGVTTRVESLDLFKQRIVIAAEKLIQLAKQHDSVVLIGHGVLNRFLAKQLLSHGWTSEEVSKGNKSWDYKYWQFATYTKN